MYIGSWSCISLLHGIDGVHACIDASRGVTSRLHHQIKLYQQQSLELLFFQRLLCSDWARIGQIPGAY
jgi:hypothetical protein